MDTEEIFHQRLVKVENKLRKAWVAPTVPIYDLNPASNCGSVKLVGSGSKSGSVTIPFFTPAVIISQDIVFAADVPPGYLYLVALSALQATNSAENSWIISDNAAFPSSSWHTSGTTPLMYPGSIDWNGSRAFNDLFSGSVGFRHVYAGELVAGDKVTLEYSAAALGSATVSDYDQLVIAVVFSDVLGFNINAVGQNGHGPMFNNTDSYDIDAGGSSSGTSTKLEWGVDYGPPIPSPNFSSFFFGYAASYPDEIWTPLSPGVSVIEHVSSVCGLSMFTKPGVSTAIEPGGTFSSPVQISVANYQFAKCSSP